MQNAMPTTQLFFVLTAYCLLPTAYYLPATAQTVYTGGHLLEFRRKTASSRNFSARSARLPDGKARSASHLMQSRFGLTPGFPGDQDPSLQGPRKTAISISAYCSVSQALRVVVSSGSVMRSIQEDSRHYPMFRHRSATPAGVTGNGVVRSLGDNVASIERSAGNA